ncbi:hypothetical protein Q1695_005260 [Nippostrongylus brasiliensis]|nr:hypothetical protein Q1695_005260 [Nippostrongylus brasiliensis]
MGVNVRPGELQDYYLLHILVINHPKVRKELLRETRGCIQPPFSDMSDGHQEKKALRKPFASHQLYDSNIDTELKDVEGKQANSLTPVKKYVFGQSHE